jgi:chromosome segregation ATPase
MRNLVRGLALVAVCALAAACGKAPAEQALKAADAAIEAARPELAKYAPAELRQLTSAASAAKAEFDKGDYAAALKSAQDMMPKIQAAVEAAQKKKAELTAAFDHLKGSLPAMVESLTARVTELAAMKKLPKGIEKAAVTTAQADLGDVTKGWSDALARFGKGDLVQAVEAATKVKTKVEAMTQTLQPPPPAGK